METKLLSTSQAAEILGVDDSRVRQLILSGKLPSMQIGRAHLIKEADLSLVKTYGKAGRPKKEPEEEIAPGVKKWKAEQQALPVIAPTTKTRTTRTAAQKTKAVATKKGGKK